MSLIHSFQSKRSSIGLLSVLFPILLTGCSTVNSSESAPATTPMPHGQSSYEQYLQDAQEWMGVNRRYVTDNHDEELQMHLPFEYRPQKPNGKGILMIHGFSDSPFNFQDFGRYFADRGYLVRGVLIPGHGTKPEDMLNVTFDDWDRMVEEQTKLMAQEVDELYIAGFSAGGNLAVHEAYENSAVDGMILFAPALAIRTKLYKMVPVVSFFTDWLIEPEDRDGGLNRFRYRTVPMQALETFTDSMESAMRRLQGEPYTKPVMVFFAENDTIVDSQKLLPMMQEKFTSPYSRFVWYGDHLPEGAVASDKRLTVLTDFLPEYRIRSFSHLGIMFSPENPWYGSEGKQRYCLRGQSDAKRDYCHTGKPVWYGSWREDRDGHPYARLTFNPYFEQQNELIDNTLKSIP